MKMAKKLASGIVCAAVALGAEAGTLPSGYVELEYLESSGTQYINTEIVPKSTTRIVSDFSFVELPSGSLAASGWVNGGGKQFWFGVGSDGKFKAAVTGNSTSSSTGVAADTGRHSFDISTSTLEFDGTEFANQGSAFTDEASGNTLYLFAGHVTWSPYVAYQTKMRLYSCQIYDGASLVRDFVPVRRVSDSTLGLYDCVAGSFFVNAGSGSFSAGSEAGLVPPGELINTNDFERAMEISIGEDKVPAANVYTNFQVLVRLSETRQSGFHYADCGENGSDVRFTLPDGSLLAHEVDTWNTSGESLVWVNITNLTAATKFRMFWKPRQGKTSPVVSPSFTWPGYAGVWHFNDAYPTNSPDSSASHYHAVCTASDTTQIDGPVGKTYHHPTANAYKTGVTAAVLYGIANVQNFTISGWMKADSSSCGYAILAIKGGVDTDGWGINMQNKDTQVTFRGRNNMRYFDCPSITTWRYFTCVYTWGGNVTVWVDGTNKKSSSPVYASESPGIEFTFAGNLVGSSDELRIRNGATSEAHAQADYKTQTDAGFLSYGKVETQRAPGTAIYLI